MKKQQYIKEFEEVKNNKFSAQQSVNLFYGLIFNFISDREIFIKNTEIDLFIKIILKKEYKKYLFNSRPYLLSRVVNDLRKEKKYNDIIRLNNNIIEYLSEFDEEIETTKKRNKKNLEDEIIGWVNHVNHSSDSE